MLPKDDGMLPVSAFPLSCRYLRLVREESVDGSVPLSALLVKSLPRVLSVQTSQLRGAEVRTV